MNNQRDENNLRNNRIGNLSRQTTETSIQISLDLDGSGEAEIQTGLPFFDHMLTALAFHARWDLKIQMNGDLHVDDHHSVEDCGLAMGELFNQLTADKVGLKRFGFAYAPLDESLARCVVDLSGRPTAIINLELQREMIGTVACENLTHFFNSFAMASSVTLHLDVLRASNDHHRAESAFKALALAIKDASRVVDRNSDRVPSTKGTL